VTPSQGFLRWSWSRAAQQRLRWPVILAMIYGGLSALLAWAKVSLLVIVAVPAPVVVLLSLIYAAIQFKHVARHGTIVPPGWSAIVDGGILAPGTLPAFDQTAKGIRIPPEFEIVVMGPGIVTDNMGNTIGNRVWYRAGRGGNTLIG